MRPIEQVQRARHMSLVAIAKECAGRGLSLAQMAGELELCYSSLKRALSIRGYSHPVGIDLVAARIHADTGWSLQEYIQMMISEGLSRNRCAKELGVDNKTLQDFADRNGLVFPIAKPVPRDFTNIIAALRSRTSDRDDLIWIEYEGQRKYLEQWAKETGIGRETLRTRLKLGWSVKDTLTTPVGNSVRPLSKRSHCKPASKHPWRSGESAC